MKLDDYLIRSALAERNWPAAVDAVARHFATPYIKSLRVTVMHALSVAPEIEVFTSSCYFGWNARLRWYEIPKTYGHRIDEEVRIWIAPP